LALIGGPMSPATENAALRPVSACQLGPPRDQAGAKLLEHAKHMLFELGHAMGQVEHPGAPRAGQRGQVLSQACDGVFSSGGICGKIHAGLQWVNYLRGSCKHHRSTSSGASPFLTTLACTLCDPVICDYFVS